MILSGRVLLISQNELSKVKQYSKSLMETKHSAPRPPAHEQQFAPGAAWTEPNAPTWKP